MELFISTYTPGHNLWNNYLKAAVNLIYGCYVTNPVNLVEISVSNPGNQFLPEVSFGLRVNIFVACVCVSVTCLSTR